MNGFEDKAIEVSKKVIQFYIGKESFHDIIPFLADNFSWNGIQKGEYGNSLEDTIFYYELHKSEQVSFNLLEEEQYNIIISSEEICVVEGYVSIGYYKYSKSYKSPLIMTFIYQKLEVGIKLVRFHLSIPTIHNYLLQESEKSGNAEIEKFTIEDISQDFLTKLYSEKTAEKLIDNYIKFCSEKNKSVLFLIAVDDIKEIYLKVTQKNTDLILEEIAQKLKTIFRSSDIIACLKDKSFLVFMKDIKDDSIILLKCQKICYALNELYKHENINIEVTASVGAAILTQDDDFSTLLLKAKETLKKAVEKGKGQYEVDSILIGALPRNLLQTKYDRINVIPVCLNLLLKINQPKLAINRVLEIIGELYSLNRAYIFELSENVHSISMNYEWRGKEVESKKLSYQKIDCSFLERYISFFAENEVLQWSKNYPLEQCFQSIVPNESLAGMQLLFYIMDKPIGILGIEYKKEFEQTNYEDINLFRYIAQIIGVKLKGIRYENKISFLSGIDAITGFMNYSNFYELGEEIIQKKKNKNYVICSFEIESLSEICEWYGYSILNKVIRYFSDLLKNELPNALLLGKDGNSIFHVFANIESKEEFLITLDKLYKKKKIYYEDEVILLQFLGGVYFFNDLKVNTFADAIDRADMARKSICEKQHTFVLYNDEMEQMLSKEMKLVSRMYEALEEGEFKLYIQPKYRLSDEKFVGAEALLRWISPQFGFLSPDRFIPIFEKNEFIIEIDFFVLRSVCEKLQIIYKEKKELYTISVNQSRVTITKADYIKRLQETLSNYDFPEEYIELEITESVFGQDMNGIVKVVEQIKKLGCMVSIDDFGSGFSSLNMVRLIPFDVLKLDREFLPVGELSERSHQVIESIIEMANRIHVQVICEGVETRNQVEFLEQIGCDHVQGYYFAKPMPIDNLDTYLMNNHKAEQTLKEMTEKGLQIASRILGDLFHQKIYMADSEIYPSRVKQLLELVQLNDNDIIGIKTMFLKSQIQGSMLILLKKSYASCILKGEEDSHFLIFQMNEDTINKLEQLGNIVVASYAKIVKEKTKLSITDSYTEIFKETIEDMLEYTVSEMNGLSERVRCIENRFYIHKNYREELIAQLFLFLDKDSEELMIEAIEKTIHL